MQEIMDIVFVLDRSGSMASIAEDTIEGYNSYLKKMKGKKARVTTVLFDDEYKMITQRKDISLVKPLTSKVYYPRGSTALLDAIGKTINFIDHSDAHKVLFIITTDGYENSSLEYTKDKIKKLIEKHFNWEFIYLGADIDSYSEASLIGIKKERTSNFKKSGKGVKTLFSKLNCLSQMFENDEIDDSWKDGLE